MANQLNCEDDGESGSEDDIAVLVLNGFVKGLFMVHQRGVFRDLPLLFFSNSPLPPEERASQPVTHSRSLPLLCHFSLKRGLDYIKVEGPGSLLEKCHVSKYIVLSL
ncbi:hypothetical protein POM88_027956 [Heracleum sosnowskyi]|uniref:Uncharacterized protein n=1 Tax=Heracleum sosnowskyi TaxID=360622 RepID=A0AAD8MQE3_9APIA|nr:hypothetical protein POM88_027956 [Heracleum sosnowskyi]